MSKLIDGRTLSRSMQESIKKEIKSYTDLGKRRPFLGVILVGNDTASKIYVARKERACHDVGIETQTTSLVEDASEKEVLDAIASFDRNPLVDGILVQLPLPDHLDFVKILSTISAQKDVDGLTPYNQGLLALNRASQIPCTPLGIMKMFESIGCDVKGKVAAVIGRSILVGAPIARLLTHHHATVMTVHSRTKNASALTKQADILVVAAGVPNLVDEHWVKEGAVVIDVGIHRIDGKICGDVDFERVKKKVSWITPVPGGVGPMTIACLLHNCFQAYIGERTALK